MKIRKFKESNQNWTENKILKMYDERSEFAELVREYLFMFNNDLFKRVLYLI